MSEKKSLLIIGGGGREHAIIQCLKRSKTCGNLYCAPGNAGIAKEAECFETDINDKKAVINLAKKLHVDMVFVATDNPLVDGLVDDLETAGFKAFGPKANAAIIEGSKVFSKKLMKDYNIPTARYEVFEKSNDVLNNIHKQNVYPTVIKADGLAFGKGVILAENYEQAKDAVKSIMDDKIFGKSGNRIVVEEFLTGPEVSVLAFCDGKTVIPMVSAQDHKRVFDGDMGPNTGGMGAVSPSPYYSEELAKLCMKTIYQPTLDAMANEGRPFKGCLFFGLMLTADGPKVIEYNCRFGDPETQVVLPRLKTDLIDILYAIQEEKLHEIDIEWDECASACVIISSGGYPGIYETGAEISGINENGQRSDATIFHSGTKENNGVFYTNGGRVIGISTVEDTLEKALDAAYTVASRIHFSHAHYRKDIGKTRNNQ